jgi:hypothetical protein
MSTSTSFVNSEVVVDVDVDVEDVEDVVAVVVLMMLEEDVDAAKERIC